MEPDGSLWNEQRKLHNTSFRNETNPSFSQVKSNPTSFQKKNDKMGNLVIAVDVLPSKDIKKHSEKKTQIWKKERITQNRYPLTWNLGKSFFSVVDWTVHQSKY